MSPSSDGNHQLWKRHVHRLRRRIAMSSRIWILLIGPLPGLALMAAIVAAPFAARAQQSKPAVFIEARTVAVETVLDEVTACAVDGQGRLWIAGLGQVFGILTQGDRSSIADIRVHGSASGVASTSGGVKDIDFIGDPEGSRLHINDWVEDQTEGRIEDLLPPDSINDGTRMVLANAVYFLADWQTQFDPDKTESGEWRTTGAQVDLMHMEEVTFGLAWGDGYTALELPYGDGERSMVIYLPDEEDIGSLRLGPEDLVDIEFQDQELTRLVLPRFELLDETDLRAPMQALGVLDAWEMGIADFSGLADIDQTQEPLFISGAFHKAFVAVDEAGTEAAAATAVVVGTESAGPEFVADRPFVFVIRDTRTEQVLFMGRLVEP